MVIDVELLKLIVKHIWKIFLSYIIGSSLLKNNQSTSSSLSLMEVSLIIIHILLPDFILQASLWHGD